MLFSVGAARLVELVFTASRKLPIQERAEKGLSIEVAESSHFRINSYRINTLLFGTRQFELGFL